MTRSTNFVRSLTGCLALCGALPSAASAGPSDDPLSTTNTSAEAPIIELPSSENSANPRDLPGRAYAPRTQDEANQPPAVQTGAATPPPDSSQPFPPREWFGTDGSPWTEWSRATGDWGGARTQLENAGITIAGSFTFDWSSIFEGGADRTAYSRRFLDFNATIDLEKIFGLKGGSVYVDFYHYGGITTNPVGDAQGTDGFQTSRSIDQVAELWYQQTFWDGALRLKFGKIDANVEFAFLPVGTGFVTLNATWDTNILGQPTYPDPATGFTAFFSPTKNTYLGFGFFDGATQDGFRTGPRGPSTFFSDSDSASWFFEGEAGLTWEDLGAFGAGRLAVGGWGHTGDFVAFDSRIKKGTQGGYIMAQQQFTRRGETGKDRDRGLFGFARANFADGDVTLIQAHIAFGTVLKGTFGGRENDEAGLMWSFADISNKSGADADEHNIELYYKVQLFGSVSITPDVQYISAPSGQSSIGNTWLGTLSISVAF